MPKEKESTFNTNPPCCINLTFEQAEREMEKLKTNSDKVEKES